MRTSSVAWATGVLVVLGAAQSVVINQVNAGVGWVAAAVALTAVGAALAYWITRRQEVEPSSLADRSAELAHSVSVSVQWPDAEVQRVDALPGDTKWWVVYAQNSGTAPVQEVIIAVSRGDQRLSIDFPPLEPGKRQWYILRPGEGFNPGGDIPEVAISFSAFGYRWNSNQGHLQRVSEDGSTSQGY